MDLPFLEVEVNEEEPKSGILKLLQILRPDWDQDQVRIKSFTEGITNRLVGVFIGPDLDPDSVLVRVFGSRTDLFVDRSREVQMVRILEFAGCAPRLYCCFKNGLCYEYLQGAALSQEQLLEPHIYRLIAAEMAKIHSVSSGSEQEPFLWNKMEHFLKLIQTGQSEERAVENNQSEERAVENNQSEDRSLPSPEVLRSEINRLRSELNRVRSPVVLCHNDLLTKNIIHDQRRGCVRFIDFEYTDYNYQAFDIGNHFNEFAGVSDVDYSRYPSPDLQRDWIRTYLTHYKHRRHTGSEDTGSEDAGSEDTGSEVTEQEVTRLYVQVCKFSLASNLFWGMWAVLQSRLSSIDFDFSRYAAARLGFYFEKRDEYLSLDLDLDQDLDLDLDLDLDSDQINTV